jgi:hypothetical protein
MKEVISNMSKAKFSLFAAFATLFGDLIIVNYLYRKFSNPALYQEAIKLALQMQNQTGAIPPELAQDLHQLAMNSLIFMLTFYVLIHLVTILFFIKGREFAWNYIRILAKVGAPGMILWGLFTMTTPYAGLLFIVQGILYAALTYGINIHRKPKSAAR